MHVRTLVTNLSQHFLSLVDPQAHSKKPWEGGYHFSQNHLLPLDTQALVYLILCTPALCPPAYPALITALVYILIH